MESELWEAIAVLEDIAKNTTNVERKIEANNQIIEALMLIIKGARA